MIGFWAKMMLCQENKLCKTMYMYLYNCYIRGEINNKWLVCIKNILDSCGLSFVWHQQNPVSVKWLENIVKQNLKDQFVQKWNSELDSSSKGAIYRIFKCNFCCEDYLLILSRKLRNLFVKYRTTNHHLPIEIGRWNNTPREDRKCGLCEANQIGDEFHYVLECSALSHVRKKLFSNYYLKNPNILKFRTLMSSSNHVILMKMCTLIRKIFDLVGHPT